jgi:hypothetical protein
MADPNTINISTRGQIKVLRMPNILHMKQINRAGLNQASGNFPAGSNVRFVRR